VLYWGGSRLVVGEKFSDLLALACARVLRTDFGPWEVRPGPVVTRA
jgi:hypothetical protein